MKKNLSKTEAKEKINNLFKKTFTSEEMRKTKRLAMKYNIKLGNMRKNFCKKCLNPLAGKISISKSHKTVICKHCNTKNKFKII